jgi:quercetin dioxygenase-like cupin family protein
MKRAEHQPETISVVVYAGIYYKQYRVADAGTLIPQHRHDFPHLTALLQGSVRVYRADEMLGDYHAPAVVQIPAGVFHTFLTLEPDCALACIHNADHIESDEPAVAQHADLNLED